MRALLQRVTKASVASGGSEVGSIGRGLCILLGVGPTDTADVAAQLAAKSAELRIFADGNGKMNRSLRDVGGQALVVSQFTLYADTSRGLRPGFTTAAPPDQARPLVEAFTDELQRLGVRVAAGVFGAEMLVEIHNDGPVTIWLDSDRLP
ncbi:MAG: D-tyrosyl-tRNA(Tyr) deacylase [Chloroflexota bacterium]|nr:D-tyrosyl-tRNA(Tyr) deacylase [Chloroflexota bacterium]